MIGDYPVFGIGLLFWLVLIVTSIFLIANRVRKGTMSDFLTWLMMGGCFSFLFVIVGPRLCDPEGLPIRGYGVFLMLAILLSSALLVQRGWKLWKMPADLLITTAVVAVITGLIGARIFFVLEYWDQIAAPTLSQTIFNAINLAGGGLVVFGSIIGGTLGIFLYLLIKKLPILATMDLFAPALMLGIAIGRLGCLMNGCCFGGVCDCPWAITFPAGSPAHIHQLEKGEAPLAGIVLKLPESKNAKPTRDDRTIFNVKEKMNSRWTREKAPVIIESIMPKSPAALCGMREGLQITALGFVPDPKIDLKGRKTTLFSVTSNADIFDFLYDAMTHVPESKIVLVCKGKDPKGEEQLQRFLFKPDYQTVLPVHPTQIYSSLSALLLCLILCWLGTKKYSDGILTMVMFLLYSLTRFGLEMIRTDEASFLGTGLSVSQCVALLVMVLAGLGILLLMKKSQGPIHKYEGRFSDDPEEVKA